MAVARREIVLSTDGTPAEYDSELDEEGARPARGPSAAALEKFVDQGRSEGRAVKNVRLGTAHTQARALAHSQICHARQRRRNTPPPLTHTSSCFCGLVISPPRRTPIQVRHPRERHVLPQHCKAETILDEQRPSIGSCQRPSYRIAWRPPFGSWKATSGTP